MVPAGPSARSGDSKHLTEVRAHITVGGAGPHLIDASRDAALMVVGRRIRRSATGTHIGPVTQALLHHAAAPVAVVPHV
ncbi:hypothetical protein Saso_25280 [Streptomyces asoensis]|uniref:UspA domain-containing protein n=1 Tax=Streptomyces asoensis TaxID=249586 RepID=A0ABQ3RYE2_9ACTN|nr:hypothetical protein GCM10010496_17870 [Streptomyces asoensis]GHI60878.1 hypothetical protein Saso_25280 [Streptomyces asoensis]